VGIQGVKLNGAIDNAFSEYNTNTSTAETAINNTLSTLYNLWKQRKISLVEYRRQRLAVIQNYEEQQLAADFNLETDLILDGANFVKDSLTGMVPVPGVVFDKLTSFGNWLLGP